MSLPFTIVFDLDDTLYLERDFVRSGFKAADTWLRRNKGVEGLEQVCLALFEAGQRTLTFDRALDALGLGGDQALLAQLIRVYRSHDPAIALTDDAKRFLATNPARHGLITDGLLLTQQAKVRALGLDQALGFVLCTAALGEGFGKPHSRPFRCLEAWAAPFKAPLVYVADNPRKDFVTPKARGWMTVEIARPERVHDHAAPGADHEAHMRIRSLDELQDCLHELASARAARIFLTGRRALRPLAADGSGESIEACSNRPRRWSLT
ncbi:HAD family hydrolase [Rhodoligotrophos defluvii]|uniref:HAD family hydrolase n=1 Tax=Rhodoligotrophos defluvii TaxID=2561934 RepID=UPI0010C9391E|nr:HAD family hydrolase [Rhodoligotrophos defluvii]